MGRHEYHLIHHTSIVSENLRAVPQFAVEVRVFILFLEFTVRVARFRVFAFRAWRSPSSILGIDGCSDRDGRTFLSVSWLVLFFNIVNP